MSGSTNKRTLDAFFVRPPKKPRLTDGDGGDKIKHTRSPMDQPEFTYHPTYPFPIPCFPNNVSTTLMSLPSSIGKTINHQAHLDLLYFQPYIPKYLGQEIFQFLRDQLPFYRVEYKIKRGGVETNIRTPRYTTVFGIDETSRFNDDGEVTNCTTGKRVDKDNSYYKHPPRPIPKCLDELRISTEAATGCKFNFCLVNYYASGSDSISYHSDDERFLGTQPAIASFSLGAKRDFLMKHKPIAPNDREAPPPEVKPMKFSLATGDMILMRGSTQANWQHSIPKRKGKTVEDGGRINITFRRALVRGGTENYYVYNVGTGPVYKWDNDLGEMRLWKA